MGAWAGVRTCALVLAPQVALVVLLAFPLGGSFRGDPGYVDFTVYVFYFTLMYRGLDFVTTIQLFVNAVPPMAHHTKVFAILGVLYMACLLSLFYFLGPDVLQEYEVVSVAVGPASFLMVFVVFAAHMATWRDDGTPLLSSGQIQTHTRGPSGMGPLYRRHLLATVAVSLVLYGVYFFFQFMVRTFGDISNVPDQALVGLGFQVGAAVLMKVVEVMVDSYFSQAHMKGVSAKHLFAFLMHMFFFVFYRALFERIREPWVFAVLQAQHVVIDTFKYVGVLYLKTIAKQKTPNRGSYDYVENTETEDDGGEAQAEDALAHIRNRAVDYGVRQIANVAGSLNFVSCLLLLKLPWLRTLFTHTAAPDDILLYVAVAVCVEVLLVVVMHLCYRVLFGVSLFGTWLLFLGGYSGWRHFIFMLICGMHVSTDIVVGRILFRFS